MEKLLDNKDDSIKGFGGWLWLLAIHICYIFIRTVNYMLININDMLVQIVDSLQLIYVIFLGYLVIKKKRVFRLGIIFFYGFLSFCEILQSSGDLMRIFVSILIGGGWITYVSVSKRIKNTFVH